ncbi:MAG: NAD(P)H-dependent oxidoreductase [Lachnospiraceae bacterium]|nr:NAD(P)H-dependent oxidoreductase [Lachnospiraceae bacterium]
MDKTLVAYFSASGVTEKLAKKLAQAVGGNLHEIVPETPYTKEDLNWMDKQSRSSKEMADRTSRPKIANRVEHMEEYDVVYIGFPVWWYREPSIIDTFMENEDLSGKVVIPFATSGGSPIGDAGKNMQQLDTGANVLAGKKLAAAMSVDELKEWSEEMMKKAQL